MRGTTPPFSEFNTVCAMRFGTFLRSSILCSSKILPYIFYVVFDKNQGIAL